MTVKENCFGYSNCHCNFKVHISFSVFKAEMCKLVHKLLKKPNFQDDNISCILEKSVKGKSVEISSVISFYNE